MKKLIGKALVAAACVVGCGIASAQDTCYTNGSGTVIYYCTNAIELAHKSAEKGFLCVNISTVRIEEMAAVDDILFASPSNINVGAGVTLRNGTVYKWKKSAKKWYDNVWSKVSPNHAKIEYGYYYGDRAEILRDHDAWFNRIDLAYFSFPTDAWITNWKKSVIEHAMKTTKRQLRSEGVSFVVKDGVNHVQDRLDALTAALDAPRMAGIVEAAQRCGLHFTCDLNTLLPTVADINQLKDDVFNGEVEFHNVNKGKLLLCLGVTEYNTFVKAYNGDEQ